jgi:ankyrin repeat protein
MGADFEAKDHYGRTALKSAARNGHESTVRLLLKKGADIEAKDRKRETALYKAASDGQESKVRLLLEKGADISEAPNIPLSW